MNKFNSIQDFNKKYNELKSKKQKYKKIINICGETGCIALGARDIIKKFEQELKKRKLENEVLLNVTGCHGYCQKGPICVIEPGNIFYSSIDIDQIPEIIEKTIVNNQLIDKLLYIDPVKKQKIIKSEDISFYSKQTRLIFRLHGIIDPLSLDDYITYEGYQAMAKALIKMKPEEVIEEIKESGLRGRGGAGFPTGLKWNFCRNTKSDEKYLICNADEGDPGAFMDRSVLEGTPHAVLEGMIIAAYAIGATSGIIYVRAEYPLAILKTKNALKQAKETGLLGNNILGTNFSFDIEIREGAGAFVCGEETALIASLEGKRGMPQPRPPFPAQKGYKGKPTNINNVETYANVPLIILKGKNWYKKIGTETSKGTKIFALAGKVNNTGLVEVPMGTTLRQIIYDIGGGIPKNRKFKAAQMGGPSGGCVPAQFLDLPIDYESVKEVGAIMGSGGLIVMDENTCVVDIARYFLEFVQNESCGKCVPCRVGTKHMLNILKRITRGKGKKSDIEELERLANVIKNGSLCGLGQTAPNPVLSTLKYFREEYEEHINKKWCRASVCEALVEAPCSHACPAGVNIPQYIGLIAENRINEAVEIIRRRNPFISVCGRVCDAPCERRCRRSDVDEPIAIRALKRFASDNTDKIGKPYSKPATGKKEIAIIGSGPAGLTCAYFLALMGRPSVVFEELPIPGGMLAVGIPEYRLPKSSLSADIDYILSCGIELKTNHKIKNLEELKKEGFKAIFIATGAHKGSVLNINGEKCDGVVDSLLFLRKRALEQKINIGKKVAVIGGGNAAIDAARSALRMGAEKVMILYRRSKEEMPAYEEEIEAAIEEGIEISELIAPKKIIELNKKVKGIELIKMKLGNADYSGRRKPVPIENSEFTIECDMVIPAIGQKPSVDSFSNFVELNNYGGIFIDEITGTTSNPEIFAGGDCVTGGNTVVEAIGAGQKAAMAIDKMLGGNGVLPIDTSSSIKKPSEEDLEKNIPRIKESLISVNERVKSFEEVICTLTPDATCTEAERCLRCDLEKFESLQTTDEE